MDTDALISGIASLFAVALYVFVGWQLSRRAASPKTRIPAAQFTLFWFTLAAVSAIGAFESLVAAYLIPSLDLVLTLVYLEVLLLCVLLWALVGYLTYLFTGREGLIPLTLLYAVLYLLLLYYVVASAPTSVTVSSGVVGASGGTQVGGPILAVLYLILLAPEFVGAALYFTLAFRTRDPTVRYRVTLVSWGLIGWFGLSFANIGARLGGSFAAQMFARSLPLIAALVVLLAYFPPRSLRDRYGIAGLDDAAGGPR